MKLKTIAPIIAVVAFTGCASITQDATHPMRITTKTAKGVEIKDAQCELSNKRGDFEVKSGKTAQVRRSDDELTITCKKDGQPEATGTATSRTNGSMWGNVLAGGPIGAAVDHSNGKAYTYPEWVQMVFGERRLFDRRDDVEGQVNVGKKAQ